MTNLTPYQLRSTRRIARWEERVGRPFASVFAHNVAGVLSESARASSPTRADVARVAAALSRLAKAGRLIRLQQRDATAFWTTKSRARDLPPDVRWRLVERPRPIAASDEDVLEALARSVEEANDEAVRFGAVMATLLGGRKRRRGAIETVVQALVRLSRNGLAASLLTGPRGATRLWTLTEAGRRQTWRAS